MRGDSRAVCALVSVPHIRTLTVAPSACPVAMREVPPRDPWPGSVSDMQRRRYALHRDRHSRSRGDRMSSRADHDAARAATLAARTQAETMVSPVLDWPEERLALLFNQLAINGWTRDRAIRTLAKQGWWLA